MGGKITIIGAVEMELTEARAILNRLAREVGREAAEDTVFADISIVAAEIALAHMNGEQVDIGRRLRATALTILALEIMYGNEVTWRER